MKKVLFSLFALLGCIGVTVAQPMPKGWQKDVENYAHRQLLRQQELNIKATLGAPLLLEIPITKQYFTEDSESANFNFQDSHLYRTHPTPTYRSTVGCKAYAISDHWIMAGASCLWNARHEITWKNRRYATGLTEVDFSAKYLKVDGEQIPLEGNFFTQPAFTLLPHVILVHIPPHSKTAQKIRTLPKPEILAFVQNEPSDFPHDKCFINSSRFGLDVTRERKLQGNADTYAGTVTVKDNWRNYAGLSTDPIFFTAGNKVLWFGFNDAVTVALPATTHWQGKSSTDYVYFNAADLEFIKHTIQQKDPQAAKHIAQRLHLDGLNQGK